MTVVAMQVDVDWQAVASQPKHAPQRVAFDGTGEFLKTVRERVNGALADSLPKGATRLQRKSVLVAIWFMASFVLLLSVDNVWLQLALCISYGLAASAVGFNIFHDANHGALSENPRVNAAVAILTSAVLGPSRYLWKYKHNVLHHRFTNIHGWDDDLETRGFLRISPEQPWKARYRGQHIFVFVLYAINAIEMVFVKDFVQYFTLRINPYQRIPAMSGAEKAEFWATKAVFLAIFIALPIAVVPLGHFVVGFLVYQFTVGLALALVFGMAHQVETAAFPVPQGSTIPEEWAAHQMRTTANFANFNPGWNWYTGGLNHQIEHHLFPSISHTHYSAIRQIVHSTALEFHLPYNHFETYGEALHSHYQLLRKLSKKPLAVSP
jgi:linoleoyl-CoA desaturase